MTMKTLSGLYGSVYAITSPVSKLSITASGYLGAGITAAGLGTYTIVNGGVVKNTSYYAISLAGSGVVTNTGTIRAYSTAKGAGVILDEGGTVTNAAGGRIGGFDGVAILANSGTVNNQGLIAANGKYGVLLAGGGTITNGGTANSAATIQGTIAAFAVAAATVHNYGTLTGQGSNSAAAYLKAGGEVTNGSAADKTAVMSGSAIAVAFNGAAGTLINYGSIRTTGTAGIGVAILAGGEVTNGSTTDTTASIYGSAAAIAALSQPGTVRNFGTLSSGAGTAGSVGGVYLKAGGTVTNGSATDKTATIDCANLGVGIGAVAGLVTNYGMIEATGTAAIAVLMAAGGTLTNGTSADTGALIEGSVDGVAATGGIATVSNFGTILGGLSAASGAAVGVYLLNGGVLTNGSAGDTKARIGGLVGAYVKGGVATISNFGTMGGTGTEIGAGLGSGGRLVNGSASDTTALIQGYVGVLAESTAATVQNFGTILAGGGPGAGLVAQDAVGLTNGGQVINGSATDTKAFMTGEIGISTTTLVATVSNFGSVIGDLAGVDMSGGGRLTNGSVSDVLATIKGTVAGVNIATVVATVTNFGTIDGGKIGGAGVAMVAGGSVTNGSATDHAARIYGFIGVNVQGATSVTNNATISGDIVTGSYGVFLQGTSKLTNSAGALILARSGVGIEAGCTASNFGTIIGVAGPGVKLLSPTARLNVEAGSSISGGIQDHIGGVVDVVGGVAAVSGIELGGKLMGAGTLDVTASPIVLYAGASLSVAEIDITDGEIFVETKLTDSKIWRQNAGTLTAETGEQMTFTGTANSFSGTITGAGAVVFSGGADTFSNLTISTHKTTINKSAVTFSGAVGVTGTVNATSTSLVVAAGGASFTGGGELLLSNNATNSLKGASSAAVLTNGDTIRGAGHLGGESMGLTNTAAGIIEGVGSAGLDIDVGGNTIANAGIIEALTGNVTTINSAVGNTGTMASLGGTLVVVGAVTGAGVVHVFGGQVDFAGAFNEHVSFGSSGRLVLAHSTGFTATVSGFSHTGTTSFDLQDITFSSATSSFSGTTASGILTVTDGTHTAHIHLTGDYTAASWTLSNDGGGGTVVVDPTRSQAHAVIAAAAGMAASGSATSASQAAPAAPSVLLSPH